MKNLFIIHGINGSTNWMKWLKNNLTQFDEILMPSFLCGKNSKIEIWEKEMDKLKNN